MNINSVAIFLENEASRVYFLLSVIISLFGNLIFLLLNNIEEGQRKILLYKIVKKVKMLNDVKYIDLKRKYWVQPSHISIIKEMRLGKYLIY